MAAYQTGDAAAFRVLYGRHSRRVYGFLMKSLRNQAMADDVFQATFLKLHAARGRYDATFPFVPWLFTVCRSAMVDSIRAAERVREDADSQTVERAAAEVVDEAPEHPDLPDLSALPEAQRSAVELRYAGELSFDEIARRLETSPANVRQLISRAVRKLRAAR